MVGGPNGFDQFYDLRNNNSYTEPTLAGNAGLFAALISLTSTSTIGSGVDIDTDTIFNQTRQYRPQNLPPP